MFEKILIANRGEIACRIIKTARAMGIRTVAVYSTVDKDAHHVLLADEAVCIGPAPASQSYLQVDAILAACQSTGAQAVHPGYGFLSENPQLASRLEAANRVFIGPTPAAIQAMGDKITAKKLAQRAGVSTVPGYTDPIKDAQQAIEIARKIGYPVMLKATAGGGGKGMRIAQDDRACRDGFERATSEAQASFGDGRVFLEKYIQQPRHIEIQVLADRHGHIIALGERECSLQRRHQKVIEEAPSPFLDPTMRAAMQAQAIALATAVHYQSAGTVEFLVDADRQFYFLEMNTRLQVEHPVTEFVTGIDIVEWMIRIAAGEALRIQQSEVPLHGWAMEARVYAENPLRNFLPSVGRLVRFQPPAEASGVRVDSGVSEGGEISIYYDPLVAKVIAHGASRERARVRLRDALNEFAIRGISHNISFLTALVDHPRFRAGNLTTDFIAEEFPLGFHPEHVVHDDPSQLVAVAAAMHRRYRERAARITGQLPGYERPVENDWVVVLQGQSYPVRVTAMPGGHLVDHNGRLYQVLSDWQFGQLLFRGTINGEPICMQVERRELYLRLWHWGAEIDVLVLTARAAELLATMPAKPHRERTGIVCAPMPGLLTRLLVQVGSEVQAGEDLAVMEAMKMENVLNAHRAGRVVKILAQVGDSLAVDQPILELA